MTVPREAELAKIWAWDAGFFACMLGILEIVTTQINVLVAKNRWCLLLNQTIECAWLIVL